MKIKLPVYLVGDIKELLPYFKFVGDRKYIKNTMNTIAIHDKKILSNTGYFYMYSNKSDIDTYTVDKKFVSKFIALINLIGLDNAINELFIEE